MQRNLIARWQHSACERWRAEGAGGSRGTDHHYFKVDSLEILTQDECVNLASGRGGAERKSERSRNRA